MPKFRVMIHGHNFLMEADGVRRRMGFYTQVFAEAEDLADAEARAVGVLRQDSKLRDGILNPPDDRPSMSVEEIEEIATFDGCTLPRTGLAFYAEEEA